MENPPISFSADEIGQPGEKGKRFSVFSTSDERVVYSKSMYKKPDDSPSNLRILDQEFDEISSDEIDPTLEDDL